MAHIDNRGFSVVIVGSNICQHSGSQGKVFFAAHQRLSHGDALEGIGISRQLFNQIGVFIAMHQVRRLHDQSLDTIFHGTVQRFGDVVNHLTVPVLHMVNDDLAGESPANAPVGECPLQSALNSADGHAAAVIEARSEGDHQQFLLPDFIRIQRVVQRGVTGFIVLFLFCILSKGRSFAAAPCGKEGEHQTQGQDKRE